MSSAIFYSVILVLLAVFAFYIAIKSFLKKEFFGTIFGLTCFFVFLTTYSYICSILLKEESIVRVCVNIYFGSISVILALFLNIIYRFTKIEITKYRKALIIFVYSYSLLELIMFIINIFYPFIVDIAPSTYGTAPYFIYENNAYFYVHLSYSYLITLIIFLLLVRVIAKTPSGYRRPYGFVFSMLILIIIINAAFLFIPSDTIIARFDISLIGYYILIFTIYFIYYYYQRNGMASVYKEFVIDNINQGYLLFSYENKLVLQNNIAKTMLNPIEIYPNMELRDFVISLGLDPNRKVSKKTIVSQISIKKNGINKFLRVTTTALFNKKNQSLGFLFVINNTEFEIDPLTSFQSYAAFVKMAQDEGNFFPTDMTLCLIDINNLTKINSDFGHNEGDSCIQSLSNLMRTHFPSKSSYFFRGKEATLSVFTGGLCVEDVMEICEIINKEFKYSIEFAVTIARDSENLLDVNERGERILNTRKVLNNKSFRSGTLNSLFNALQQLDTETSEHVKRTQDMALKLGKQIKLSQEELSNLLLLAVLHDIGKIGIPLEILNKPTPLTKEEFEVIKTHSQKGYNIAMSSPVLNCIAKEILHHHERWDGNGYPGKLKGEDIPILSRVVSIVDSYDAMISDRSYRKGMSTKQAILELEFCSGKQFDPNITAEFIKILKSDSSVYEIKDETTETEINNDETNHHISSCAVPVLYSRYLLERGDDIVYIDDNFTKITGYTQEDIRKGLTQTHLIPVEDRIEYFQEVKRQMNKSNSAVIEHRIRRKDGKCTIVFCYGKKFYDSSVREFRDEIIIYSPVDDTEK